MNDPIRDLWGQCVIKHTKTPMNWQDVADEFAKLIILECASIIYKTCQDGDAGAQAILYEFDIDNARSQK